MNSLSKRSDIEVSVLFTSPVKKASKIAYDLNAEINIINDKRVEGSKFKYFFNKLYIRYYQYINKGSNVEKEAKRIFSRKEIKNFQTFFDEIDFDFIIGVAPYISSVLSFLNISGKNWLVT